MTPGRGQHAKLTLAEIGTFPAVVDMSPGRATAMLLARPLHPLEGKVGAEVGIDITTKRGLLHIDAELVEVPNGEVLELGLGEEQLIQRRSFARVDAFLEVVATPAATGAGIPAAVVNISACGAVVSRLSQLDAGDEVRLSLQLAPYEPPVEIVGRVVREFDDEFRAVHFEEILEADRERIIRFVFDRQRLERREGRM